VSQFSISKDQPLFLSNRVTVLAIMTRFQGFPEFSIWSQYTTLNHQEFSIIQDRSTRQEEQGYPKSNDKVNILIINIKFHTLFASLVHLVSFLLGWSEPDTPRRSIVRTNGGCGPSNPFYKKIILLVYYNTLKYGR